MSLFSFLRKNKQESAADDKTFYSRAEEDSKAVRSRRREQSTGRGGRSENAVDPVLPEKKRARRRLIGAIALVLAAVVGLPMILDTEPKPLGDDIVIQIPSKEKRAPAAPSAPPAPPLASNDSAASLDEKEEVVEAAPAAIPRVPQAPAAQKPEHKPAAAEAPPRPERKPEPPVAKPERKPESKPESKPENKPAQSVDEAARARALLEGKTDPKAEQKNSGKYVIQVAALATKEKVNELQSKLRDAGIKSYTQTVGSGTAERTRIRVGPFASKDEAEKVRARIVKLGLNGSLVPA